MRPRSRRRATLSCERRASLFFRAGRGDGLEGRLARRLVFADERPQLRRNFGQRLGDEAELAVAPAEDDVLLPPLRIGPRVVVPRMPAATLLTRERWHRARP